MKKIISIIKSPITYLLFLNLLGILLFIFFGFIVGEIILPGILSDYMSLGKFTGIIFLTLTTIVILAKEQEINFKKTKENSFLYFLSLIAVFLLTFISLYKFGIIIGIILTIISFVLFILLKKYFLDEICDN